MKNRKNLPFIGLSIFACAVCCAAPILGFVFGVAVLTWLSYWTNSLAIVLVGMVALLFVVRHRRKVPCAICCSDCDCKLENGNAD